VDCPKRKHEQAAVIVMSAQAPFAASPDSELGRLLVQLSELLAQERFADAIPVMTRALELQPANARLHADLGGLYVETGRYADAIPHLQRAIALNPRIGIAHWRLGSALQMLGDTEGSVSPLEEAVSIRPDLADAHLRLALAYRDLGRRGEALQHYRKAAECTPGAGEKQLLEAQVLMMERREREAEALLRAALESDPDLPTAHGLLGQLLAISGRFEEAQQHMEAQLARSPRAALGYYDLVRSRKMTEADAGVLQRIDFALEDQGLGPANRSVLLLARGKVLDDLGRYEEAMRALDEAAALRMRTFSIDVEAFEKKVDSIVALFSREVIATRVLTNPNRTPVFIVGMPRSGTTLAEQIFSSHPDAAGGGELSFWTNQLQTVLNRGAGVLTPDYLESIAAEGLAALRNISATAARISDKNPFNFLAIGLIHLAFPLATIVHCRRNPVDTAISIHQTHFARSTGMPTGGTELVRHFRAYQRLMEHWRRVLPAGRIFELSYERLTSSPQIEIRRLIDHVGLPWDPACLNPHVNTQVVRTPSGWQVRQSINTGSVDRWKRYEPWLGPLAALLEEPTQSAS
jgi:tetratricopeptide (TPR) repeat protein